MRRFFGSLLFSLGMIVTLFYYAPLAALVYILRVPYLTRFRLVSGWARFNIWWLRVTCNICYEVEGEENIPDQPQIIFCKHESTWETMAMQQILPPHVWILKQQLLLIPLFGWGLASLNPIAINRSSGRRAVKEIIQKGQQRLDNGRWVMIFPEGTRMPAGTQRKFGIGGAVLAEKTGYNVLPVAHNAGSYWPKRGFLKKPGTIKVVIGKPIQVQGKDAGQINQEAEAWMKATMERISGSEIKVVSRKK
jgi:1-acyl-sn-glycerol-3-phosphate acyltransferase